MASPFSAPVAPPSFEPQIASLGNMIDVFNQRRMELQRQREQAALAQANQDRLWARDAEREAYGRRKQDIAEKKVDADIAYRRAQATHTSLKEAKAAIAAGRHPGTMLVQGPDGNPVYVEWKYVGGKPEQQSVPGVSEAGPRSSSTMIPAREVRGVSEEIPPGPKDRVFLDRNDEGVGTALIGPEGERQRQLPMDSFPPGARDGQTFNAEDVNLRGGKGNPFAEPIPTPRTGPVVSGSPNTIFLDRNDEGEATALMGADGEKKLKLPIEAFPPGAKEGQTFDTGDVNLRGGKGNPFAEPIPTFDVGGQYEPEESNTLLPASSSTFVPGVDVRGVAMDTGQAGGRWEAVLPDGQVVTVDPNEARAAKRDQDAQDLRDIDVMLADPATKMNPQLFQLAVVKKQALLGGMSPAEIKQVYAQTGQFGLQDARLASNQSMQKERLASQEKIAAENNATRRATSKYGRGVGGKGKGIVQSSGEGSAFSRLKPAEQARIENAVNNGVNMLDREMNWTKLEGVGFDRLNLALQNIRAKGDLGGAQQMEAMMNFFGYIRGGVPAKNETDEFKAITRNLGTMLDSLGQKVGVSNLWTNFTGSQEDKAAIAKIAQLPEGQRAALEKAIVESQRAIQDMALKNISAQAEAYKSAGAPFHERMQDKINSKLRFIGEKPRQWFADSPLIPDFDPGAYGSKPKGDGAGKPSLDAKLDALNKALGL